jgi:hypothetical protein
LIQAEACATCGPLTRDMVAQASACGARVLRPVMLSLLEEYAMGIPWSKDVDASLAQAKETARPILLDFSAAPA